MGVVFGFSRLPGLFPTLISLELTLHHSRRAGELLKIMDSTLSLMEESLQNRQGRPKLHDEDR